MRPYSSLLVEELEFELKLRELRVSGPKADLIKRLKEDDWEQWLLRNPTFHCFPDLPLELQLAIFRISLPGPRTILVEGDSCTRPPYEDEDEPFDHFEVKLDFSAKTHTPNPAALGVCRSFRNVALEFYRLCFGTTNVYADLPGGDILCFGHMATSMKSSLAGETSMDNPLHIADIRHGDGELPLLIAPSLASELRQVTNIALGRDTISLLIDDYGSTHWTPRCPGGPEMRERLFSVFPNLAVLSLIIGGNDTELCETAPSQLLLEPANTKIDRESEWSLEDMDNYDHYLHGPAYTIIKTIGVDLTDEERKRGIPRIELVHANRLLDAVPSLFSEG